MTDLNTLIPAGSPLFLLDGNAVNSRGEIVGDALQISTGEVHAYLATPCDGKGLQERDVGGPWTTLRGAQPATIRRSPVPENVRTLLRQHLARRYHLRGQAALRAISEDPPSKRSSGARPPFVAEANRISHPLRSGS